MIDKAKMSICFFDDREVRAIWDEENNKWWFSVLDIVAVLTSQDDYTKTRNYWKYLKAKLKREGNELGSVTTQLKLKAPDGKKRLSNVLDYDGVISLLPNIFPITKPSESIWIITNMQEGIIFPGEVSQYKPFSIRETISNLLLCKCLHNRAFNNPSGE